MLDGQARHSGNLLFVDEDAFLAEMIESGLHFSRPQWSVIFTRHPSEALDVLEQYSAFDALITEAVFEQASSRGIAFIREVGRRWPDIPIFVMTALGPDELGGLDPSEYIAKPPDMDFLVSRVDRAIRRQRESLVRGISLVTFLQILEIEKKTCTVFVSHGGQVGELYVRQGCLVDARMGPKQGSEALFDMLSLREHSLRVIDRCDVEGTTASSLTFLLMQWSVRADDAHRGRSTPPMEDE